MIIGSSLFPALYQQPRAGGPGRQDGASPQVSDPMAERLAQARQALAQLKAQPTVAQQTKQAAAEKLGWLKQRLNALKMLLAHASPQDAKALLRELKSIARELASVAKNLGSSGGGSVQASVSTSDLQAATAAAQDDGTAGASEAGGPSDGAGAEAEAAAEAKEAEAGEGEDAAAAQARGETAPSGQAGDGNGQSATSALRGDGQDQSLKESLMEVRQLFKAVLHMIKAKLDAASKKEGRDDLKAVERDFAEFDQKVGQLAGENTYAALANGTWGGLDGAAAVSGQSVDLKA